MLCIPIDDGEGYCTTAITGKKITIDNKGNTYNGKSWDELLDSMAFLPMNEWTKLKIYVASACRVHRECWAEYGHIFKGKGTPFKARPIESPVSKEAKYP